jgi:hypothetical protein
VFSGGTGAIPLSLWRESRLAVSMRALFNHG